MAINHGQIHRFAKSCTKVVALGALLLVAAAPIAHAQGGQENTIQVRCII